MCWMLKLAVALLELLQTSLFHRQLTLMPGAAWIKVPNRHRAIRLAIVNESLPLFPTSCRNNFYVS